MYRLGPEEVKALSGDDGVLKVATIGLGDLEERLLKSYRFRAIALTDAALAKPNNSVLAKGADKELQDVVEKPTRKISEGEMPEI